MKTHEGRGRPKIGGPRSITLTEAQVEWLERQMVPGDTFTATIRRVIHQAMQGGEFPSYREGVELIALNDDPGSDESLEVDYVDGMLTVKLLADLFHMPSREVAKDVVKFRKEEVRSERRRQAKMPKK